MSHEFLGLTIDEVVGANNRLATCDDDGLVRHDHLLDCLFTGDETLHGLLLVKVNDSDHLVPISCEHVVPIFFDADN